MKIIFTTILLLVTAASAFAQRNTFDGTDLHIYFAVKESKDSVYTKTFPYGDGRTGTLSRNHKTATVSAPDGVFYNVVLDGAITTLLDANQNRTIWIGNGVKTTIIHPDGRQSVLTIEFSKDRHRTSTIINPEGGPITVTDNYKAIAEANVAGTQKTGIAP